MLYVKIIEYKNRSSSVPAPAIGWSSRNDLFAVVKYHDQTRRTTTKWKEDAPNWNESFIFDVCNDDRFLMVQIFDDNYFDDDIKVAEYPIKIHMGAITTFVIGNLCIEMGDPMVTETIELQNELALLRKENREYEATMKRMLAVCDDLQSG